MMEIKNSNLNFLLFCFSFVFFSGTKRWENLEDFLWFRVVLCLGYLKKKVGKEKILMSLMLGFSFSFWLGRDVSFI